MKWKKDSKSMTNFEAFYWNFSVIIQSQNVKSDTAVARASLYSSSQKHEYAKYRKSSSKTNSIQVDPLLCRICSSNVGR